MKDVVDVYKKIPDTGTLIIGEKGSIFANPWNAGALIKLKDDAKFKDMYLARRDEGDSYRLPAEDQPIPGVGERLQGEREGLERL